MKIIDPSENFSKISELIKNANEFVVLVSPYTDLEGLDSLIEAINNASERNVKIYYYVREKVGIPGTEKLNVELYEVPGLHAKMFFSEKEAIIGSFHLKNTDEINWGYILEYPREYNEMKEFFESQIKKVAIPYNK